MKRFTLSLLVSLIGWTSASFAKEATTSDLLNPDNLATLSVKTIHECAKDGAAIGITVTNEHGIAIIGLRHRQAAGINLKISRMLAYTAAVTKTDTRNVTSMSETGFAKIDPFLFEAGGVPIFNEGKLIGAVGVSGASTSELDAKCALFFVEELEFLK